MITALDKRPLLVRWLKIVLAILLGFYVVKESFQRGDFGCYLLASEMVADGLDPYVDWIHIEGDNYCLYFYSPLWATLLIPFTKIPPFIPNLLWLSFSVFCFYRSWRLLLQFIPPDALSGVQKNWIVGLSLVMTLRFMQLDFTLIQMTAFLLWGSLESLRFFRVGKYVQGALLLGLIVNIKILPLVLLPYLVYRGYFKGAAYTMGALMVYLMLPAVFLGWDVNLQLVASWYEQINPASKEYLLEVYAGPHSLSSWIPTMLTQIDGNIDVQRNFADVSHDRIIQIVNAARAILILLTLVFLGWPPFRKAGSSRQRLREIAYVLLIIPLIFPHQQKYAFVFIAPAAFFIIWYLVEFYRNKSNRYWLVFGLTALSFALMTLTTDGLIGRSLNEITQHFKMITWGALLMVLVLLLIPMGQRSRGPEVQ